MRIVALEEHVTTPEILKAAQMPMSGANPSFLQAVTAKLLDSGEGDADNLAVSPGDLEKIAHRNADKLLRL